MRCAVWDTKRRKEARVMCGHERLRTVGDRVFCCECGEELSLDLLESKGQPSAVTEQPKNAVQDEGQEKPKPRKRTAKKAV